MLVPARTQELSLKWFHRWSAWDYSMCQYMRIYVPECQWSCRPLSCEEPLKMTSENWERLSGPGGSMPTHTRVQSRRVFTGGAAIRDQSLRLGLAAMTATHVVVHLRPQIIRIRSLYLDRVEKLLGQPRLRSKLLRLPPAGDFIHWRDDVRFLMVDGCWRKHLCLRAG